jgi:hypothetical protein
MSDTPIDFSAPAEGKHHIRQFRMAVSVIVEQGATLHREYDRVQLGLPDGGKIVVPTAWFDALIDERKIAPESSGFYRLTAAT